MINYFKKTIKNWETKKESKRLFKMVKKISKREYLTKWENNFVDSVKNKDLATLTSKQVAKLEEIYRSPDTSHSLRQKSVVSSFAHAYSDGGNTDLRFCEKNGVSYDDVHDFDK